MIFASVFFYKYKSDTWWSVLTLKMINVNMKLPF